MPGNSVIGALRVNLGMNAGEFDRKGKKASASLDRLAKSAQRLGTILTGAFATGQVVNFIRRATEAWGIQEEAIAQVNAALETTGGTAGFTSKELQKIARSLQAVSKFGDEEILKDVTGNMLTFGNIVGPIFLRAQEASLDLSQTLRQDLKSSAIQLGKALNDPILGVTALSRVGITFTQQQRDQIRTLVESNKVMEAQSLILAEVEKFYGRAAEAAAETTRGRLTQAANVFSDAMESIGEAIAPVVLASAKAFKVAAETFASLSVELKRGIVVGASLGAVLSGVALAAGVFITVLGGLAGPITLTIAALGTLAGVVTTNWRGIKNLAEATGEAFSGIYDSAKTWLVDRMQFVAEKVVAIARFILTPFRILANELGISLQSVVETAQSALAPVEAVFQGSVDRISEIWNRGAENWVTTVAQAAPRMISPVIEQVDKLKLSAEEINQRLFELQQQQIDAGVQLADQLQTPNERLIEQQNQLRLAYEKGKITAGQLANAQVAAAAVAQNAYANVASSILGSLEQVFGQSKGIAIAQALVNSYQAFTNALANIPPPLNVPAAAAALAAGLAQVANIRKTTKTSGGAAPAAAPATVGGGGGAPVDTPANAGSVLTVRGLAPSELLTGDAVEALARQLLQYQADGGQVVFV